MKLEHCRKVDCFAFGFYGKCMALSRTNFADGECPFYKTKEERLKGHLESIKTLEDKGRYDLIEKYGHEGDQTRVWREIDGEI